MKTEDAQAPARAACIALITTVSILTCGAGSALSSERALERLVALSLDDLMQVEVITAGRKERTWQETPAALHVIVREDIRRSGARTVPDLLRLVPGMHVARLDSHTWAASARGFASAYSDKLLVMIDGRSVYTPLFSGVFWDRHELILEDIERIEVVRGPGASVWGVNAVNGVINIITRDAVETRGTFVMAGAGNEDEAVLAIRHGGRLGSRGHHRVWAKQVARDSLALPTGGQGHDAWNGTSAGVRFDWTSGPRDRFVLAAGLHRSRWDQMRTTLSLSPPHDDKTNSTGSDESWDLSLRWDRSPSRRSHFRLQAWLAGADRDTPNWRDLLHEVSVEVQHDLRFTDRHDLSWGLGFRRSANHDTGSFEVAFQQEDHEFRTIHAFVQGELGLSDRLRLTLGTKLDTDNHRGVDLQPSVRLAWTPREELLLWAAGSRALRTPNQVDYHANLVTAVEEDPGGGPPILQRIVGSEGLGSERLVAWEAGLRWQPAAAFSIELAGFSNRYHDLRTAEPGLPRLEPNGGSVHVEIPIRFDGLAAARAEGGELALRWLVQRRWKLSLAWSYLDLQLRRAAESIDVLSETAGGRGHSPRHRVHLSSRIDLPRGWELDLELDQPIGWNGPDIAHRTRLDLRLGWRSGERFELSLSGQDLLSDGEVEFGGDPYLITLSAVERSLHGSRQLAILATVVTRSRSVER